MAALISTLPRRHAAEAQATPAPLSAAREELRRTITVLATASKTAEAAAAPVARLNAVLAERAQHLARLQECHRSDREVLARLIAGQPSARFHFA
jgi:hypothetical protein